jgi:hypothetical protein
LAKIGAYDYVAETTILRPLSDRPLYCLCYATRHSKGIEVFRDSQTQALREQAKTRAATKVKHAEATTGQREIFESLDEMAPNELETFLAAQRVAAEKTLLDLTPVSPHSLLYRDAWPRVLAKHVVRLPDVNQLAAKLRKDNRLSFPDWERGKRVPQSLYRMQRRFVLSRIEGRFATVTSVGVECDGRGAGVGRTAGLRTDKPCGPGAPGLALSL